MVVGNNMSDARDERIARYKEERRRQLAAQFGPRDHQNNQNQQVASPIRSTRASRLRSQANSDSFKNNRELIRDEETSPILVKSRITSKRISDGSDIRRKSMVSPNLVGICSPKTKKPPTSSPPSNSPIPRSAQLVKRISSNRNERGLTPESDSSLSGKDAVPSLNSKSNPTSPAKHPSILKKSSLDEPLNPISILKRKTSNDEQIRCSSPLRFSPNVVERKGRGILKKHRSLDDPQVRVSTEAVLQDDEHRSILKSQQRRCSLDEVVKRAVSPEPQSILKRKASREEIENGSEPQGILKKKTSITEEPIFETSDPRPILKKKSFEDEEQLRPILKTWRRSIGDNAFAEIKQSEEVKPILKHTEVVMRNKKSLQEKRLFRHSLPCSVEGKWLSVAERVNGLENFMSYIQDSRMDEGKENGTKGLVRSGSVSERATIFSQIEKQEKLAAEAARAKRNLRGFRSRKSEPNRFSTQPVTSDEVEQAKRNNDPDCDDDPSRLTLAERVALFTKKPENKDALLPPPPAPKRIISNSMSGILVEGLMKNLAHKDSGTKRLELRKSPVESEESSTSTEDEEDADDSDHREQEEGKENRDVTKLLARIKDSNTSSEEASSGGKEVQDILNLRRGFKKRSQEMMGEVTALRRCATQPIPRDEVDDMPKTTIAERLAALRKNDNNWLKRVPKAKPDEEIVSLKPPSGGVNRVSDRLGQLETASQGWKARVGDKDAVQFTVAGKMSSEQLPPAPNLGGANRKPKPVIFTKNGVSMASASTPSVPDSLAALMKRSISVPEGEEDDKDPARIKVPETYDDDFSSFFANADVSLMSNFTDVDIDFEEISHSSQLHVQRRNVRVQRKHKSANPLKALAARTDLKTEYVEVKMGVADREIRRMNIEKLSKNCGLAVEALAGLASKEDLSAISLRKAAEGSPSVKQWNHPILLRIKGRRRPLTTIVKPHYKTINQGDSFILVTQNKVFHWVGEYSNVIEKSRGADIALHIQTKKDLGCSASSVVNLDGTIFTERHREFWKILNLPENLMETYKGENAGHPGEDEVYEKAISETFVVYSLTGEKLVPVESYWGRCPKIDILDPSKVLVFDFGSEVYMWAGKNADMKERRQGNSLANELYKSGYRNNWQPTSIIWLDDEMENDSRPEWSIFSKVTQHMEPIVFKEKFIDWPDFTRVIRTKDKSNNKQHNGSVNVHPCDYKAMLNWSIPEPDLVLEGSHLGRGKHYYDEERRLNYEVTTKDVKVWQIENNVKTLIDKSCLGNFHEEDSYVVRWHYCVSTSARELSGLPSKHADLGRDRIAHMVWHGRKAPVVEQGTAALLTSLGDDDSDHGPILTVDQGTETPAFAAIFPGPVVFHYSPPHDNERLYLITGEIEEEILLHEVKCESSQLRSRASLWFLNVITGKSYLWHGAKTSQEKQNMAYKAVTYLKSTCPKEFGLDDYTTITIKEIEEGDEPYEFLGGSTRIDRESYCSLLKYEVDCDWTPRLFHLSSLLGDFIACPVVPARHHPKIVTPYPYTKKDLYSTSQPSLLLLDVGNELWLWCGWWEGDLDARGTAWGRYQAERKAAMTTALQYWTEKGGNTSSVFIVYAGLEPSKFKSYFALWEDKCDPAYEFNVLEGHYDGEVKKIQDELATLEERCYPVSELTSYPLPGGVDPTRLEYYLDPVDFKKLLGVSKEEFEELPIWKRTNLKKTACLF